MKALQEAMTAEPEKARDYAKLLYAQACLGAGLPLEDPTEFTELIWDRMLG